MSAAAVTQEGTASSAFPQTIYYACQQSPRVGDDGARDFSGDDAGSKRVKRSTSPKSTGSATYITSTPLSSTTNTPQTSTSSMRNPVRTNVGRPAEQVELSEDNEVEDSEWKPYCGDRYVRANIPIEDLEKALEGGDYVIIEEEVLEEIFVQEPGERPNIVRRIRRRVLKSKSKEDLRIEDSGTAHCSSVAENSLKETNLRKDTDSELLDVYNVESNKDSGIDCAAKASRMSEAEKASYPDDALNVANSSVLSANLPVAGTIAGKFPVAGTTTSSSGTTPGENSVRSNEEGVGERTEGGAALLQPCPGDAPRMSRSLPTDADDEDEGEDSEDLEAKSDAAAAPAAGMKMSTAQDGQTPQGFSLWTVVQQRNSGVDPLLSNQSSARHQPRRFQDPYQLDRHAVWYGDKYKWMTGVPLPAWVMELRISDESAFTECMEHFQAFGRWPSDAELGPCPAAIPAAGGGFMHNPAAPLPTFVKLTRERHLLNQYFAHFRVFGRWPRIS